MSEIIVPTVGRMVHYFSGPDSLPQAAMVVEGGDLASCLSVYQKDEANPVVFKWSVQHRSHVFWDWPEIK